MDTPTIIDATYCHKGIKNMLTHMHKEALALHDSFLNFCPLPTSCSVTLGLWLSQFVSMYVKQKGREIQFALSIFHTTSVPCLFNRSLYIPLP